MISNIIENHDEPRGSSRFLPEYAQNEMGMKMLGTVSVLLRGLPFLFQGQEIGMQGIDLVEGARLREQEEKEDAEREDAEMMT